MVEIGRRQYFKNRDDWRPWLKENHVVAKELWLVLYKKRSGKSNLSYEQAVEEALCFGWIDGIAKSIDDAKYVVRFTERKSKSIWSQANQRRVAQMIKQGRMTRAGLAKVEEAKQNGEWTAAAVREDTTNIPSELRQALDKNKPVRQYFESLAPSHKRQYIYWITSAKTDATRQKRVKETLRILKTKKKITRQPPHQHGR